MWLFFLSNLNMGGGGSVGPVFVSYVVPWSATVLPDDAAISDVDPAQAAILN